jgi:HAD superfamily hydrolase (TIGR01509 family)
VNPPRFIYFDLGNVLLTFDHAIACRQVAVQTGLDPWQVDRVIFASGLQLRYEAGQIGSQEFVETFVAETGRRVDPQAFLRACSDIFELNAPIVPVVAQLRMAGYRLGVLSNTCPAHWEFVSRGRFAILPTLFDVRILSYERGALKPSLPIYQAAIAAAGVAPGEIFFTDDRAENVSGARDAGLDATLFQGVQMLLRQLQQRRVGINL